MTGRGVRVPGLFTIIAIALVLPSLSWDVSADCAAYLEMGRRISQGAVPYVDFIDTNPPLIMYLNVIPAILGPTLGTSEIVAFRLLVTAIILLSALMIGHVLNRTLEDARTAAILYPMILTVGVAMAFDPRVGQREHLFAMLYLPYLFVRWSRGYEIPLRGSFTITAGLLAGVGASIKPHFLIVAVTVEAYLLLRHRRLGSFVRPECMAFLVVCFTYALHFLLVPRPMRHEFFGRLIPLMTQHYDTFRGVLSIEDLEWMAVFTFIGLAVPALAWFSNSGRKEELYGLLGVFTVSSVVFVYLGQRQFRGYHLLPAQIGAMYLFGAMVTDLVRSYPPYPGRMPATGWQSIAVRLSLVPVVILGIFVMSRRSTGTFGAATALLSVAGALWMLSNMRPVSTHDRSPGTSSLSWLYIVPLAAIVLVGVHLIRWPRHDDPAASTVARSILAHTSSGDKVLILSTLLRHTYPLLLDINRMQGSRYLVTFPFAFSNEGRRAVAGLFPYPQRSDIHGEEARFIGELGEDIAFYEPKMIFVLRTADAFACPEGFVIADYLRHLGFFREEMSRYRAIGEAGDFEVFLRDDLEAIPGDVNGGAARPGASSRDRATRPGRRSLRRRPASSAGVPA